VRFVLRLLALGGGIIGGLALLLFAAQRRLLYFPERQDLARATEEARRLGLEPWLGDGGRFLGWRAAHPSGRAAGRLLVLHGNGGHALHRLYFREAFQAPAVGVALDVYLLEYPGYGPRPGAPSEGAFVGAALEAVDLLGREAPGWLLVLGESLGSAVAAIAAAERPGTVAGVLLVTPLKSVPAVARRHYPFVPEVLLRDTYRADQALPRFAGPVAFLVAERDEVVFADLGRSLFQAYPGRKRLWIEEGEGHNTIRYDPRDPRWGEMVAFLLRAGR
jgi:pimeloyl-ACP methyl ester carboxylesterase